MLDVSDWRQNYSWRTAITMAVERGLRHGLPHRLPYQFTQPFTVYGLPVYIRGFSPIFEAGKAWGKGFLLSSLRVVGNALSEERKNDTDIDI